jgi:uncharacterized peroxidase-related enzyme
VPHIKLQEGIPGILGPMMFSPETAKPLNALAEVLLRAPNSLTPGEREMIATYVSSQNDCYFCQSVHGAVAAHHLGGNEALVLDVKRDFAGAAVSEKMKALLTIAGKVQEGGQHVTTEDVERARAKGANDKEIHDTVLIAAAFCMYNRYVDGLATWAPTEPEMYRANGETAGRAGLCCLDGTFVGGRWGLISVKSKTVVPCTARSAHAKNLEKGLQLQLRRTPANFLTSSSKASRLCAGLEITVLNPA